MTEDPQVVAWLTSLGLVQYRDAFAAGDVDAATLSLLTADDLVDLGVGSVGHRRRLLSAIEQLVRTPSTTPQPDPETVDEPMPVAVSAPGRSPWSDAGSSIVDRRHLTILFCDMVGSTALSRRCDPEQIGAMFREFFSVMAEIIDRYEGHEANRLGDGSLVFFGYPKAQEDAALRAVLAAEAMVEELHRRVRNPLGEPIQVCVGMASGVVVVDREDEKNVFGDTPNIAARVQGLAAPGEIVLAESTARLVRGEVSLESGGEHALKGLGTAMRVWRLPSHGATTPGTTTSAVPACVGREHELQVIAEAWERARLGDGSTLIVSGEAGIGKSHLANDAIGHLLKGGARPRIYRCSPFHVANSFWPFRRELADAQAVGDSAEIADPRTPALTPSEARARRNASIDAYVERALTPDADGDTDDPVLILVGDVQWSDPSSREVFARLAAAVEGRRALMLVTARLEVDLSDMVPHDVLTVGPLSRDEIVQILTETGGVVALPREVVDAIADRADGVPLFAEELARSVEHALLDDVKPTVDAVPATLQDSLQARIDRLGPGAELLRVAAVLGREAPLDLVRGLLATTDEGDFAAALTELAAAGLLDSEVVGAAVRRPCVVFRHQLVRDCAYDSILLSERLELHARIAEMLAAHDEVDPDIRAMHEQRAGNRAVAARLWAEAGNRAAAGMANAEAVGHFEHALALVDAISEPEERNTFESDTLLAYLPCLMGSAGYIDAVAAPVARVIELTRDRADPEPAFRAMFLRWIQYLGHGQVDLAHDFGAGLSGLTEQVAGDAPRLLHHRMMGSTALFRGELEAAGSELETFTEIFDEARHGASLRPYGATDNWTTVQCCRVAVAALRGEADTRRRLLTATIEHAEERENPHNLCHAVAYGGALTAAFTGAHDDMSDHVQRLSGLAASHKLPFWSAITQMYTAILDVLEGHDTAGRLSFNEGASWFAGNGAGFLLPTFRVLYASAAAQQSRTMPEQAELVRLHQSLAEGERWVEAEALLLLARRAIHDDDDLAAETWLRRAESVATDQGSWVVRDALAATRSQVGQIARS